MKPNGLAGAVVLVVMFTLLCSQPIMAHNSSEWDSKRKAIKDRDKKVQQLEKKKKLMETDQAILIAQIQSLTEKLKLFDQKVFSIEQELEKGQNKIKQRIHHLAKRKGELAQRKQHVKKLSPLYAWQKWFHSRTFFDLFERAVTSFAVARSDAQFLDLYQSEMQLLMDEQNELKTKQEKQKKLKHLSNQLLRQLSQMLHENQQLWAQLDKQLHLLEKENEVAQQELNQLVNESVARAKERERKRLNPISLRDPNGMFIWPVAGAKITSSFGMRWDPVLHQYRLHKGLDIGGRLGAPIQAADTGEVIEARSSKSYGYVVILYHGNGLSTLYAHMYSQTVRVRKGQIVSRGQVIAAVGSNGWSTGPHLHFEVHQNGKPINPRPYFHPSIFH
ncbi:murein hydrolase activator EnvC family protein [Thermoflavimicrobium dichotomicum]|uniref:Peptidase family M23 n=1 Tax=Thermoflavimicrobium dichotomicum TaxID=46223 RepID=A0A1I3JV38_9BACL|nr:M23 family metallopeptidase [Thermoflavimicrobium dichotomicum]SFI64111.1 Peptidase family M23 [Thermoflavimicrobium dichotomicum]